ncbi:MAG: M16 family metallopeptidase [Christensenellales bacterium]|jgi:predicted Zn-dependent peptidase
MFLTHTLSNGIRIIGEKRDQFRSVTLGIWARAGEVIEREGEEGLSHFIEHMMFKGTKKRSSQEISAAIDGIGGQINAFTAKECTCYYCRVIDDTIDTAFEVLSDMLTGSVMDDKEIAKEKSVITEEIHMVEDSPEEYVHELLCECYYNDHPLAKPILGTADSVSSFTRDGIFEYLDRTYTPGSIVVAIAGSFDFDHIIELAEKHLSHWPYERGNQTVQQVYPEYVIKSPAFLARPIEQMHICLGYRGIAQEDERLFALSVMNNLLGGGMSSRLFQKIREERGLAYSVYSYPSIYSGSGMMGIYAGTTVAQAADAIGIIRDIAGDIAQNGVTEFEFSQAKSQLRGSFILGNEASSSRMMSIGKALLMQERVRDQSEILELIDGVTIEDVARVAKHCFDVKPAAAVIGPEAQKEEILKALE